MSRNQDFHDYIVFDMMKDIPGISSRRMFSGWGLYKYGRIFGLIIDGEFYLRVTPKTKLKFEKMESHPFEYSRKGRNVSLSYWTLPEEILGEADILAEWIDEAVKP